MALYLCYIQRFDIVLEGDRFNVITMSYISVTVEGGFSVKYASAKVSAVSQDLQSFR